MEKIVLALIIFIFCLGIKIINSIDIAKDYGETDAITTKHNPCNCGTFIKIDTGYVYDYILTKDSIAELKAYPKTKYQITKTR